LPLEGYKDNYRSESSETGDDSMASKALREVGLVLAGGVGGVFKGAQQDAQDPVGTTLKLAGTVGVGLTLAALERGGPLLALGAKLGGAALATSFVTDVLAPGRLGDLGNAIQDTWRSPENYSDNINTFQSSLGRVAFDTLLMTGIGVGAKAATDRFLLPESKALMDSGAVKTKSVASVLDRLSADTHVKWGDRKVPTALGRYFDDFPYQAVRHLGTGKDNIVIELTGDRILKISNKALPPDAGKRFFDLPYLERGKIADRFDYVIQPKGRVVTSIPVMREFGAQLKDKGFNFWDASPDQLVMYKGQLKLHDYDAVSEPSSWKKTGTR